MLITEELTCPKCQGEMATVFSQRPRRRSYVCSKCDPVTDPLEATEAQGRLNSAGKPPE